MSGIAYHISADGESINAVLEKYCATVEIQDNAGGEADTLTIELVDNGEVALPRKGVVLAARLGYGDDVGDFGKFVVDEVEVSGPPDKLVIKARAADMMPGSPMKATKSRSWDATTIGAVVATIAAENGLQPRCAAEFSSMAVAHRDQTAESDMHFLANLAFDVDAVCKPAGGCLIFARKAGSETASGKPMPGITLQPQDISTWHATLPERSGAKAVTARYQSVEDADELSITDGDDEGEPVELRTIYPDEDSANRAVKSEKAKQDRGKGSLSISMAGDVRARAEAPVSLLGFRKGLPDSWVIKTATHKADSEGGWSVQFEAEVAA